ncbi:aromatic-ring-hydroxylating dioxygenase subunit beta [Nocardia sp. R6R-6]|uniref:aromatic-ring-hydroxylating dioxygenase subunit beta n=1 Tax=Nocardia sp. R6R-6 TaxID=3459303 RepID=UPI00403DB9DD
MTSTSVPSNTENLQPAEGGHDIRKVTPTRGYELDDEKLTFLSAARAFLDHESTLLDSPKRLWEWFDLLSADFYYHIPVRISRERRSRLGEFSEHGYHMLETLESIRLRIERLDTEHAWAEEPPSRLRRVISGVEVLEQRSSTDYLVASSFLLFRGRGSLDSDLLAGQRQDLLHVENGRILLGGRTVLLEHTVIPTANLGVFL